jgi:iron complex outermembrane receptor protein
MIEYQFRSGDARLRLTPWILQIDDTLSRRNVEVNGERLWQRYNLRRSEGHGVDATFQWDVNDNLQWRFNCSWQDLEARKEADGTRPVLYLRPTFQASMALDWLITEDWDFYIEARHVQGALDEEENGDVVELPASTAIDLRLFRTLGSRYSDWRMYVGVNNVTDEVVLPQLGIPAPGRTATLGISYYRQ